MTEEWKPFNFKSDQKQVDGFTTQIVERIAKNLGTDISITINPWSRSYNIALREYNHAIYSIYRSPSRETLFKWVGPVYKIDTVLWGLEHRNLKIDNLEDAKKYRIIVQKDSAYEEILREMKFKNIITNATRTDTRMVIYGRGDLVPLSVVSYDKLEKAVSDLKMPNIRWKVYAVLYSKPLYIAFNKNTPDQIIHNWQAELDKIKNQSFFSELETKFIKPILESHTIQSQK